MAVKIALVLCLLISVGFVAWLQQSTALAAGYQVRVAAAATQALELLADFRPDLIRMDIQLPGIDGLKLTRRLKADPATGDVLIAALTAYAMHGDEPRAAGCDGYGAKPIDTRTLPDQLARYLRHETYHALCIRYGHVGVAPSGGARLQSRLPLRGLSTLSSPNRYSWSEP